MSGILKSEIHLVARSLIERYGREAACHAAERSAVLDMCGETEMSRAWRLVCECVEELLPALPPSDIPHDDEAAVAAEGIAFPAPRDAGDMATVEPIMGAASEGAAAISADGLGSRSSAVEEAMAMARRTGEPTFVYHRARDDRWFVLGLDGSAAEGQTLDTVVHPRSMVMEKAG